MKICLSTKIAAKIQQGVSKERILDDLRESINEEGISRAYLLAKKDISNIERTYGLTEVQRHPNDQQSVLSWIEQWNHEEDNPMLFHKLQGQKAKEGYILLEDDFLVIIQTPLQREMYKIFGSRGVCCDSTHGTNGYDFTLVTIMVIDDFEQGFPVAWIIHVMRIIQL